MSRKYWVFSPPSFSLSLSKYNNIVQSQRMSKAIPLRRKDFLWIRKYMYQEPGTVSTLLPQASCLHCLLGLELLPLYVCQAQSFPSARSSLKCRLSVTPFSHLTSDCKNSPCPEPLYLSGTFKINTDPHCFWQATGFTHKANLACEGLYFPEL